MAPPAARPPASRARATAVPQGRRGWSARRRRWRVLPTSGGSGRAAIAFGFGAGDAEAAEQEGGDGGRVRGGGAGFEDAPHAGEHGALDEIEGGGLARIAEAAAPAAGAEVGEQRIGGGEAHRRRAVPDPQERRRPDGIVARLQHEAAAADRDPLGRVVDGGTARGDRGVQAAGEAQARRFEQGFARPKVVVERAVGDAGLGGDLVDGGGPRALAGEDADGGVEQELARAGAEGAVGRGRGRAVAWTEAYSSK